jgi:tripartite ATP-independent transporter DctP family solute receptor
MRTWKAWTLAATVVALGSLLLPASTARPLGAQAGAAGPPVTLRLTWTTSLDTHVGKGAQHFVKRAGELTQGQVTVRLFPNSGLGSEQQALEGMQAGTVDMGLITVFTNAVKVGVVLDLPFLFRDVTHWKKAVEGTPGKAIADTAPAAGVRILAWYLGGWRDVYGTRAIRSVDDFKGLKIRTQQAVALVEFFKAVGAIPTPIAWPETYLALQQKTVDAAETALWAMYDAKQYEVAKFAVETHHSQSNIPVMISEQRWKTLSPDVQQALVTAARESADVQQKAYQEEASAMVAKLKEKGIVFTSPDLAPFRDVARKAVHQKLVTDPAQKAILDEIEKL